MTQVINLQLDYQPKYNLLMRHHRIPLISNIKLENTHAETTYTDISITITSSQGIVIPFSCEIDALGCQQTKTYTSLNVQLSAEKLRTIEAALLDQLTVKVTCNQDVLAEQTVSVEFHPVYYWCGVIQSPALLAAYVNPDSGVVKQVADRARSIYTLLGPQPEFAGYKDGYEKCVLQMVEAACMACQELRIARAATPPNAISEGVMIKPVEELYRTRQASTLDMALLYAACLEALHINPLIVMADDHVMAGGWLVDQCFVDSITDDVGMIIDRLPDGSGEIVLHDAELLFHEQTRWTEADTSNVSTLICSETPTILLDVARARRDLIRPLPNDIELLSQLSEPSDADIYGIGDVPVGPVVPEESGSRIENWKKKLLDLSLRNVMLNFRLNSASVLPVIAPNPAVLEDELAKEDAYFTVSPSPSLGTDGQIPSVDYNELMKKGHLYSELPEKDIKNRLTKLSRAYQEDQDEMGVNTLFLTIGMLQWYESQVSDKPRYAPIVMLPLKIMKRQTPTGYVIGAGDEEPLFNITLQQKLKNDFNISIPVPYPLPTDNNGVDINQVLLAVTEAVASQPRWAVLPMNYLTNLRFDKFEMWNDLDKHTAELTTSEIVKGLVDPDAEWSNPEGFPVPEDIDHLDPKEIICPVSADSSQMSAIKAAAEDRSFLLYGPPGTGKSQTITNIVANALSKGKRVLFVAEKMAALSVVKTRLDAIGLAPFCLELHSNKTNKQQFFAGLKQTMELGATREPAEWAVIASELKEKRDQLNAYVDALHRTRANGYSIFQIIGQDCLLAEGFERIPLDHGQVGALTKEQWHAWETIALELLQAAKSTGIPANSPWRDCRLTVYTPILQQQISSKIQEIQALLKQLDHDLNQFQQMIGCAVSTQSLAEVVTLVDIASQLASIPVMPVNSVCKSNWADLDQQMAAWIEHGIKRDRLRQQLQQQFNLLITTVDADVLDDMHQANLKRNAILKYLGDTRIRLMLNHYRLDPKTSYDLGQVITTLVDFKQQQKLLEGTGDRAREVLGSFWKDGEASWDDLACGRVWMNRLRKLSQVLVPHDAQKRDELLGIISSFAEANREEIRESTPVSAVLKALPSSYQLLQNTLTELKQMLEFENAEDKEENANFASTWELRMSSWQLQISSLREWADWNRSRDKAIASGLNSLISVYETNAALEQVNLSFTASLYQTWLEHQVSNDPVLRDFTGDKYIHLVERFRELDSLFQKLTVQYLHARLSAGIPPTGNHNANSEIGQTLRLAQQRRPNKTIRNYLKEFPKLWTMLKPCVMMSPLSVARYLDLSLEPFDLVIFDEASQVLTCEAVGALGRGNRAIIVGDDKQLPPTSFFKNSINADGDGVLMEDMPSILEECRPMGMSFMELNWHYRSNHEGLIAFSNYHYYENHLLTFPSPDDKQPVVFSHPVAGVYDRSKSRCNRQEAEAVVSYVIQHVKSSPSVSMGVVTFNQSQQQLILDLLEADAPMVPELERAMSSESPNPLFVKNLENVQGDERDIIIFSVGYGPDENGKVGMNFGPLNQDGGWRRLNVAVTRARQEMHIFSSITPEQFDLSRTTALGVKGLMDFLTYARNGKDSLVQEASTGSQSETESPFEDAVCECIAKMGYEVHKQVGCSGYRIDLAVVHPQHPGRYLLGIECDGATYHNAKTVRDRDKLRQQVLERLGWTIHRIWSTDWWHSSFTETEKIRAAIKQAELKPVNQPQVVIKPVEPPPVIPTAEVGESTPASQPAIESAGLIQGGIRCVPYQVASLSKVTYNLDTFYRPSADQMILRQVAQVVKTEGPVALSLICRRIADAMSAKVTAKFSDRVKSLVYQARLSTTDQSSESFIWPSDVKPESVSLFRIPDENLPATKRVFSEIPAEELRAAIIYILASNVSLPKDDLFRELVKAFGYSRRTQQMQEPCDISLDRLINAGKVQMSADRVTLVD